MRLKRRGLALLRGRSASVQQERCEQANVTLRHPSSRHARSPGVSEGSAFRIKREGGGVPSKSFRPLVKSTGKDREEV